MTEPESFQLRSVKEAAGLLGISVKTMWRLIDQRRIATVRFNRRVLVSNQAIEEFAKRHTISSIDAKALAQRMLDL